MRDVGHRERIELALQLKRSDHTPVNNFSNITAARSAGLNMEDVRWDPPRSVEAALRFAKLSGSDFVKPTLDNQGLFLDLGVEVKQPPDNYGRVMVDLLREPEDVDNLTLYDPFDVKECPRFTKGFVEKLDLMASTMEEDYHVCGFSWGPISTAGYLRGVETIMMDTFQDPSLLLKLIRKTAHWTGELQKRFVDTGATVYWMADPTASEDMISKDMFKQFAYDAYKSMSYEMKKTFRVPFFLHMCGDTVETMTLLPELGVDCFSVDTKVSLEVAKERIGRKIAIHGNVHPIKVMLNGTPDDVTRESMECIQKAGLDGGFILSSGCDTPRDCPDTNLIAMGQAGRDFWKMER